MNTTRRVRLTAAWAVLVVAAPVAGSLVARVNPEASLEPAPSWYASVGISAVLIVVVLLGGLLLIRRPENRVGWVLVAAVSVTSVATLADGFAGSHLPGATLGAWASSWLMPYGVWLCITLLLLLFPDGVLVSRRWRPVAGFVALLYAVNMALAMVTPGPLGGSGPDNPAGWKGGEDLIAAVGNMFWPLSGVVTVVAAAGLVVRYRRAVAVQRQQLKWLALSGMAVCLGGVALLMAGATTDASGANVSVLGTVGSILFAGGLVSVPLFAALAILRYRLYDLDRIISRTLSYSLVTGLLAALYAVAVAIVSPLAASAGSTSPVAAAVATLAVAAAFRPVRQRVQAVVDRRFNRVRYDAERTVRSFGERMREPVDVDAVSQDLLATAADVVDPRAASVWILPGTGSPRPAA